MFHRARTFIRSERRAVTSMVAVLLVAPAFLAAVALLGDQRRISVVTSFPEPGGEIAQTARAVSITFDRDPDRAEVEAALQLQPPLGGVLRWRGRTLEYAFDAPVPPGDYLLTIEPGTRGARDERLDGQLRFEFRVREPGILSHEREEGGEVLRLYRNESEPAALVLATRIIDFAPAPDGSLVAAVVQDGDGSGYLVMLRPEDGEEVRRVQSDSINLGSVAWSPDGLTLVVVRRDRLPGGEEGVPRLWLMRSSGEFIAPVDPEGPPSLNGTFSPNGQLLAYVAPATGDLVIRNLASAEAVIVGGPRGGVPAWSPDSALIAFESVPTRLTTTPPPQPVRVRGADAVLDRVFGAGGESRSAPRFSDENTVLSVRRPAGGMGPVELVFDFIESGREARRVFLAPGADEVLAWDLDVRATRVVYAVRSAATNVAIRLDLASGRREPLPGLKPMSVKFIP